MNGYELLFGGVGITILNIGGTWFLTQYRLKKLEENTPTIEGCSGRHGVHVKSVAVIESDLDKNDKCVGEVKKNTNNIIIDFREFKKHTEKQMDAHELALKDMPELMKSMINEATKRIPENIKVTMKEALWEVVREIRKE